MSFAWKNKLTVLLITAVLLAASSLGNLIPQNAYASHKGDDSLGATPPMGYSTWNAVRFNVSDALIRQVTDSMVSTGLRDLGYVYVNIDDGWQGGRDANGNIYANSTRFPNGMKALADYVHSKGMKIGIYTDTGRVGCGGKVGSYGYYQQDVNQFAEWGFDYIKVDSCGADAMGLDFKTQYTQFSEALKNANPARDILFNICEWGQQQPWNWAPAIGHTWRVGYDIDNQGHYWDGVLYEIDQTVPHASVAGPGHFNDPDSLEVGVISDKPGKNSLTYEESVSNFSMWAVLAAPLMLGLDVTTLDTPNSYSSRFADIVKNAEVIAVDQDPAGIQGEKVSESSPGLQVYSKPLGSKTSGDRAVVLLNRTNAPAQMTVTAKEIGLLNKFSVRDLWKHENKGTHTYSYSATVPAHGSVMVKISGTYNPEQPEEVPTVSYEAEAGSNILSGTARIRSVPQASGGSVVGYVGDGLANSLQFNNISVPKTGTYPVTISYVSGDARNSELAVNGTIFANLSFPSSGGWSNVRTMRVNVELNEGMNTISFSNRAAGAFSPDFDRIEVSALPIESEKDEAATQLTGTDQVPAGEEFNVRLAINHLIQNVIYAEDIQISYDANVMDFVSADSLVDGVEIVDMNMLTPGKIRFIMASAGTDNAVTGDVQLLQLNFKSKELSTTDVGTIEVTSATLANESGEETEASPSSISIEITAGSTTGTGDINGDGKVSVGDLALIAVHYGKDSTSTDWTLIKSMDLDASGTIDVVDLSIVARKIME
ncbi:MAG: cohesin domain-containing protein [Candidatus Pristimantibacillus sp.]